MEFYCKIDGKIDIGIELDAEKVGEVNIDKESDAIESDEGWDDDYIVDE